MQTTKTCSACGGEGKVITEKCSECRGKGVVRKQVKINVTVPAGIADGQVVVLRGEGDPGSKGGPAGDLGIVVKIKKHSIYSRRDGDVLCNIPITFTQSALGAELVIPMVDGSKEKYKISEGTQTGTSFTIKNKGFISVNGSWRGDFIFTVIVQTPKRLTSEQREILNKLAQTMGEQPPVRKKSFFS